MPRKRYTRKQLENLLERLVAVAESTTTKDAKARRVLTDLLEARMGEVDVRHDTSQPFDARTSLQRIRELLRMYVGLRRHAPGVGLDFAPRGIQLLDVPMMAGEFSIPVDGPVHELLCLQTARLVDYVGRDRLDRCDCERVFVRIGKRKFCSVPCQKRVYMRRFRAGNAGKE